MTDIEKVGLGYASGMCSVLVGYWLNNASANRKARRDHKTKIRQIRAAVPESLNELPTKYLEDWWLHAIDDCGWLSRWRIERCLSEFRQLTLPSPAGSTDKDGSFNEEKAALEQQQFKSVTQEGVKILTRILSYL